MSKAKRIFHGFLAVALSAVWVGASSAALADLATADGHFNEQRWQEAAEAYAVALTEEVEDANAWFQYGYSLYRLERDREALRAFERAAALGSSNPRVFGTAGICAARLGEDDAALRFLERGVNTGVPVGLLKTTPVFDGLRERPEFESLLAVAEAATYPCRDHVESRQFDFWVNRWNVFAAGNQVGTNEIQRLFEGCLIHESYSNPGGFAGASFNFYDPSISGWRQIWVDTSGQVTMYEGKLENGEMVFRGTGVGKDGTKQTVRMLFTPNADGSVRQLIEASSDEGETWSTSFDGLYVAAE